MEKLGHTIKLIANIKGVTMQDLYQYVGVTENYIRMIYKGDRIPTFDKLEKICERLEISVGAVVWFAESSAKKSIEKHSRPEKLKYKSTINMMMREMFNVTAKR